MNINHNLKEVNYCLRHHPHATLRVLGLKMLNPRFYNPYDDYHEGWAGLVPSRTELDIPEFITDGLDKHGWLNITHTNLPVWNILFIKDFGDE